MGRKKKKRGLSNLSFSRPRFDVPEETRQSIIAVILLLVGIVSFLSLVDLAGTLGIYLNSFFKVSFGIAKWIAPVLLMLFGYFLLRPSKYELKFSNYFGLFLFAFSFSGLIHLIGYSDNLLQAAKDGLGGGYLGLALSALLFKFTGFWASLVLLLAFVVIGLILIFNTSFNELSSKIEIFKSLFAKLHDMRIDRKVKKAQAKKEEAYQKTSGIQQNVEVNNSQNQEDFSSRGVEDDDYEEEEDGEDDEEEDEDQDGEDREIDREAAKELSLGSAKFKNSKVDLPLSLLSGKTGSPDGGDLAANKLIIQKTLANFNVKVEMGDAQVGPTVTQYTMKPAEGVKLSRITGLIDNLALALAAHPIRIEAPIPGRSLVGVEVPNAAKAVVPLKDILSSGEFKNRNSNLMLALGMDVMGKPWMADLKKMPHMLIAGSTGSGKSVCINSVILSLLFQNSPADLRFIMVDPKRVELPTYNGIPHLITPVITDVKKTVNALGWAIREMERRFDILAKFGCRNLETFNQKSPEKLPYIVFIIDELADLMATSAAEVEAAIVRLSQMARAVGIHLILATQRPSVDVITGLIKANITSRIAFSVASLVDSRTILDMAGAEKLLGRGDMLYTSAELGKPKRLQGAFSSDDEIAAVAERLKDQDDPEYIDEVTEKHSPTGMDMGYGSAGASEESDPLLIEAKEVVLQAKKASASLLQRRLRIGYARAARIIDLLEAEGFVGPGDGAKPREILVSSIDSPQQTEYEEETEDDYQDEIVEEEEDMDEGEESEDEEKGEESEGWKK